MVFSVAQRLWEIAFAAVDQTTSQQEKVGTEYNYVNNVKNSFMDEDLYQMSREQLVDEVKKLRDGIRKHRDSTGHELCWHHPQLWGLLPEKIDTKISVPGWPEFMKGCIQYRKSLEEGE